MSTRVHAWLPGDPSAAGAARRALLKLARSLDEDVLSDLQTVATELVTNSFRHAGLQPGDRIELLARAGKHGVRLEVTDPGPGFQPGPVPADPLAPGGRGLLIIRRLSERWGVKVSPGGCSVWCDIPVEGRVQHLAV